MKMSDLMTKTKLELASELKELLKAQFSLRMQLATQQTNKTHEIRRVRRDIARVKFMMNSVKNRMVA